jgi:hypothetical protein
MSVSSDCSVDIDQQGGASRFTAALCTDWKQLCGEGNYRDELVSSLEMYGFTAPNKLQQHVIPVVLHFLGQQLDGKPEKVNKGKSTIVIMGPEKTGKTSSVVLGVLAAIDPSIQKPQAILVSRNPRLEVEKYLRVFTAVAASVTYQVLNEDTVLSETSPEVIAARSAHILVGKPKLVLQVLSSISLPLDAVRVFVVDDAQDLVRGLSKDNPDGDEGVQGLDGGEAGGTRPAAPQPTTTPGRLRLSGLPSGEKSKPLEGPKDSQATEEAEAAGVVAPASPTDDVVRLAGLVEKYQQELDMACTYGLRSGENASIKLRHIIVSEQTNDTASRKMMKLLKASLMTKTNLLMESSGTVPPKLLKGMKHYYAAAPRSEWVRIFTGLVQSLMFPRALIYCDTEDITRHLSGMIDLGVAVSANLPGASSAERQKALQDFTSNKTQFLLTHSEPSVCQVVLPKVSCVFHFGLIQTLPSAYGVRLLPLGEKHAKESASILLVDEQRGTSKPKADLLPPDVAKTQKLYNISFMDMPWEFLPPAPSARKAKR